MWHSQRALKAHEIKIWFYIRHDTAAAEMLHIGTQCHPAIRPDKSAVSPPFQRPVAVAGAALIISEWSAEGMMHVVGRIGVKP
jgi:hypothetical protein